MVSKNRCITKINNRLDALSWLRTISNDISEAENFFHSIACHIFPNGFQGINVSMDIAYHGNPRAVIFVHSYQCVKQPCFC